MAWFRAVALLGCVFLSGCETTPEAMSLDDGRKAWQLHQDSLASLVNWSAVGRIALTSSEDSWNIGLRWTQAQDSFELKMSGPLGQGVANLRGDANGVEMRTSQQDVFRAPDARTLLREHVGWDLPIEALRSWVLGKVQPGVDFSDVTIDLHGRIRQMRQAGWAIEYQRYGDYDGYQLPEKLLLQNDFLEARLILRKWQPKP